MKYFEYMIFLFNGMAFAFFLSFLIESMNPEPHDGALLFNFFAIGTSAYLSLVLVFFAIRKGRQ
ncbi:hypothetical protein QMM40_01620 [Leptospira santarosai]|nr:hypothetical protein [Leptospira santarosai]MDI7188388.1 hypothetical protein [Leptospira santarosai]MDI7213236.1 hypothetical protein [Leptospira santarosai]